jgi:integrase
MYAKHGKIRRLLLLDEFVAHANKIEKRKHRVFASLLYYSGVRVSEMVRAKKEQFRVEDDVLLFDVGPREKTGLTTDPLEIPLSMPFMDDIQHLIKYTRKEQPIFGFTRRTGCRIIGQYFNAYPHYFRLNRITQIFMDGFSLAEAMSWSGHKTIQGVNPYIGQVNIHNIGQSLRPKEMGSMRR